MQSMSAEDIAGVQRGMADRPDSIETLSTINVPTLVIAGEEDNVPLSEAELMRDRIAGSRLHVIPKGRTLRCDGAAGGIFREYCGNLPTLGLSRAKSTEQLIELRGPS